MNQPVTPIEETDPYKAGFEAGRRNAMVDKVITDLDTHVENCSKRSERVWDELNRHTKMIYIGFGFVLVLELAILAAGPFFAALVGSK